MRSSAIWQQLDQDGYMVVTSNGKPVALLSSVKDNDLDEYIQTVKRARAILAINRMQEKSVKDGRDKLTDEEIGAEIQAVRRSRR
jgi:antitoxin (DNA-binding transcriptional repressor) of toxin-antitoxin stability system